MLEGPAMAGLGSMSVLKHADRAGDVLTWFEFVPKTASECYDQAPNLRYFGIILNRPESLGAVDRGFFSV